jgi:hypothetical protein
MPDVIDARRSTWIIKRCDSSFLFNHLRRVYYHHGDNTADRVSSHTNRDERKLV